MKASIQDSHITVLGLTTLTGHPVMCVVIFEGGHRRIDIETGVDVFAPFSGTYTENDFITQNSVGTQFQS